MMMATNKPAVCKMLNIGFIKKKICIRHSPGNCYAINSLKLTQFEQIFGFTTLCA